MKDWMEELNASVKYNAMFEVGGDDLREFRAWIVGLKADNAMLREELDNQEDLNDMLRDELDEAYTKAAEIARGVKDDSLTENAEQYRIKGSRFTAKDWMVAQAEDIERAILAARDKLREDE